MSELTRTYIIAEAGVNHNGSLNLAKRLIDVASEAGADAVKFQTFKADNLVSRTAPKAEYQRKMTDAAETQWEMIKKLELDEADHAMLAKYAIERKIEFLSTPFDVESAVMLAETFNLPYIKIPSGEITNGPLLLKIAQTGKRVILSTGMSTLGEIERALGVLAFGYVAPKGEPSLEAFHKVYCSAEGQQALRGKVTLLHCTTEYPTPYVEVNLRVMDTLKIAFNLPVGYSDHTAGVAIPVAAVARGAVLIEKHFTLDRNMPGPDHKASLEPEELAEMVRCIRQVEKAIGTSCKIPSPAETKNISVARKSLVTAEFIRAGEPFTKDNVTVKRPGTGLSPMYYWNILGRKTEKDYAPDEQVKL